MKDRRHATKDTAAPPPAADLAEMPDPVVEPEPEPAPAESDVVAVRDLAPLPAAPAGFRVSRWADVHPNYECQACSFATLDPTRAAAHAH